MAAEGALDVSDVHNVCPAPGGNGYNFALSDLDEGRRREAVRATLGSIETAARAGADRLVVHMGHVDVDPELSGKVWDAFDNGGDWLSARDELLTQRARNRAANWDALLRSLEEVLPAADRAGVTIATESRYSPNEMTSFEEVGMLMAELPQIGYWHDVGHCQVAELLGLHRHEEWLEAYGDRLVGIHLHDLRGRFDHRAPGTGEFDFTRLAPLPESALRVLEVHSTFSSMEDVIAGVAVLDEALEAAGEGAGA